VSVVPGARRERAEALDGPAHYDRYVVPFTTPYATALMEVVHQRSPRQILDHGAGTGTITRQLLQGFPDARVTALDPSQPMLGRLVDQVKSHDRGRLDIRVGTASSLAPTDAFDLIVSQLAFMFVDDPETDLLHLRAHALEGATLAIGVLGGRSDVAAFDLYWSAAKRVNPGFAEPDEYPHFRFGDPSSLADAARHSGWGDVDVSRISSTRDVDTDELWEWLSGAMPIRLAGTSEVARLDGATRQRLRAALAMAAEEYTVGGGRLRLPMNGWCLRATAT
jgi:SAM-dependent methyltransferase